MTNFIVSPRPHRKIKEPTSYHNMAVIITKIELPSFSNIEYFMSNRGFERIDHRL